MSDIFDFEGLDLVTILLVISVFKKVLCYFTEDSLQINITSITAAKNTCMCGFILVMEN